MKLRLNRSLVEMDPATTLSFLIAMRARFYKVKSTFPKILKESLN